MSSCTDKSRTRRNRTSWTAHEQHLKIAQDHLVWPPSTYGCGTPFCRASPLRQPRTYDARPTHTKPTDRREHLPHLTNSAGWQTPPREVGRWEDGPIVGAAIEDTESREAQGERGKARADPELHNKRAWIGSSARPRYHLYVSSDLSNIAECQSQWYSLALLQPPTWTEEKAVVHHNCYFCSPWRFRAPSLQQTVPWFAPAVTPGYCSDQHNFIQAGSTTRAFDLKGPPLRFAASTLGAETLQVQLPSYSGETVRHKQDARRHVNTKTEGISTNARLVGCIFQFPLCIISWFLSISHQMYAGEDYRDRLRGSAS
ncbi:hypothetical protein JB92DRAFT_2838665 [Gautieria morchelliformis]|nr:hypothetical protein JB92DRAFT_2838665 [Gautieria morchelliformis]